MLHLIICDDEEAVLEKYGNKIEEIAFRHGIALRIDRYTSAQAMLFSLEDPGNSLDILYLDVQMPGINGIEAARRLRELGSAAQIIFLTGSADYVFDSFDVQPLQYLLKDTLPEEKFEEVFLRAANLSRRREEELFACERGAERRAIPLRDISYFEVAKRIVTVHYEGGLFEFYSSIDELELDPRLKKRFVRTHRAFLVNMAHIRRLGQDSAGLIGGGEVPLGRTHLRRVKERLSDYLAKVGGWEEENTPIGRAPRAGRDAF